MRDLVIAILGECIYQIIFYWKRVFVNPKSVHAHIKLKYPYCDSDVGETTLSEIYAVDLQFPKKTGVWRLKQVKYKLY